MQASEWLSLTATWLKVATILEKPPTPTHLDQCKTAVSPMCYILKSCKFPVRVEKYVKTFSFGCFTVHNFAYKLCFSIPSQLRQFPQDNIKSPDTAAMKGLNLLQDQ